MSDPLAREIERLRAASAAFDAWRGAEVPLAWKRGQAPTGTTYQKGPLRVTATLTPQAISALHALRLTITREQGAVTRHDLVEVSLDFVDTVSVVRAGPPDRSAGWSVLSALWTVRVDAAHAA